MEDHKFRALVEEKWYYFTLNEIMDTAMTYIGSLFIALLKADKQQYTCVNDINENEIYDGDHCEFGDSLMRVGGTAYPVYVTVQELVFVGVIANGYSVCGQCGGKTKTEYLINYDGDAGTFDSHEDAVDALKEQYGGENEDELKKAIDDIEELNAGYIWYPVEFFLTVKGAEEYMKANAHNHGKLRTYVHWFESRNYEMRELLKEIGFKVS